MPRIAKAVPLSLLSSIASITAVGVGGCFATAVPSKEFSYADKVIHQYVFVNPVKNLKRPHVLKCDMDTRAELEEVAQN